MRTAKWVQSGFQTDFFWIVLVSHWNLSPGCQMKMNVLWRSRDCLNVSCANFLLAFRRQLELEPWLCSHVQGFNNRISSKKGKHLSIQQQHTKLGGSFFFFHTACISPSKNVKREQRERNTSGSITLPYTTCNSITISVHQRDQILSTRVLSVQTSLMEVLRGRMGWTAGEQTGGGGGGGGSGGVTFYSAAHWPWQWSHSQQLG